MAAATLGRLASQAEQTGFNPVTGTELVTRATATGSLWQGGPGLSLGGTMTGGRQRWRARNKGISVTAVWKAQKDLLRYR